MYSDKVMLAYSAPPLPKELVKLPDHGWIKMRRVHVKLAAQDVEINPQQR
jgi:hypothetical protein